MSTLEGAVPLGLGITKLRLWNEIHRAHCEAQANESSRRQSSEVDLLKTTLSRKSSDSKSARAFCCVMDVQSNPPLRDKTSLESTQVSLEDWFLATPSRCPAPQHREERDCQGFVAPPPPSKPGPSKRHPPPLVVRLKARARRAKRKQQKAEHRRRLFLTHMVQMTHLARRLSSPRSSALASHKSAIRVLSLLPESTGVDVGRFVDVVFDTDAQSSELTAPSEMSDDDLANATRIQIEKRMRMAGADVAVPKGVYRWMVASDFAERWPDKVKGVRDNPWPGLEKVWGLPSALEGEAQPMRWQSGPRSRFLRRNHQNPEGGKERVAGIATSPGIATNTPDEDSGSTARSSMPSKTMTAGSTLPERALKVRHLPVPQSCSTAGRPFRI